MRWFDKARKLTLPTASECLPGREEAIDPGDRHAVLGTSMKGPWPGMEAIVVAAGCFWGVERVFWRLDGVVSTSVGYAGGHTPNPTYQEVCTGATGHTEVVRVVFDPAVIAAEAVLQAFWECHDPTQGMRQGNDVGTQYRSAIYATTPAQLEAANRTREAYQERLTREGWGTITTEIREAPTYYFAEDYHQQYLHKNPQGYCGIGGTGVSCPIGTGV